MDSIYLWKREHGRSAARVARFSGCALMRPRGARKKQPILHTCSQPGVHLRCWVRHRPQLSREWHHKRALVRGTIA